MGQIRIKELFYVTFGILSHSYIRGTACEPAYSENNLNFRLVENLTLSIIYFVRTSSEHNGLTVPQGFQINCGIDLCYIKSAVSETLFLCSQL